MTTANRKDEKMEIDAVKEQNKLLMQLLKKASL